MKNLYLNGLVKAVEKNVITVAMTDMVKEKIFDIAQYHRGALQFRINEGVAKSVKITIEATTEYVDGNDAILDPAILTSFQDVTKLVFGVDYIEEDAILNDSAGVLMGFAFLKVKMTNNFYQGSYADTVVTLDTLFSS